MSPKTHTLSVLVEDKPGVLARVAALFSRRGFNIESLAVGATECKDRSRMTIVVSAEDTPLEQITKQLNKLINVIKIVEQDDEHSVSRELALIKVQADAGSRSQVIEAVNLFRANVIDVSPESLTVEATGNRGKLEALLRVLEPFGIREIAQSGMVSLPTARAAEALTSLPGVGVWTAAETTQRVFGDADAVSVGDYHIPKMIGWTLVGRPVDDAGMLELLEPMRPHRHRVVRLLEASGLAREPRRGPRLPVQNIRAL
ncbi:acetolactate synthase small subunit [Mycobacterium tuberculosis]|nr:acetolactate synthase small subunit [Mycobacterium tuberculosis]